MGVASTGRALRLVAFSLALDCVKDSASSLPLLSSPPHCTKENRTHLPGWLSLCGSRRELASERTQDDPEYTGEGGPFAWEAVAARL